MSNSIGVYNSI